MFRFENPEYLYLLVAVPVLALMHYALLLRRKRRLHLFGEPAMLRQLAPDVSRWRPEAKFWLMELALALLVVMVARPQMGTKVSNEKRTGIETVIAMDISNSMMAEDVTPSRLARTKMMVENLVDKFTDDKIALVVFAGDAFVQLPITSDNVSAKMFLANIAPELISTQGTDIARAIELSTHSFTQAEGIGRAIIVITDGEDHEGGAVEAAEAAKKKGMRVFVLGVGSAQGAPIPAGDGGYMADNSGNTVMSALNEDMCRQVAQAGGGAYIHVDNNSNAQAQLDAELAKLAKKEMETTVYSDYDEQFQAFGVIVALLLILEVCLLERRNRVLGRFTLFGAKRGKVLAALMLLSTATALAQADRQHVREGNRLFRKGSYAEAEVAYRKALEANPRNPQAVYNLGNALLAQQKDSAAVSQFEQAAKLESVPLRKSMAYHNLGVICQGKRLFAEAINAYKESLRLNPKDHETRYNLELCKRQQKQQQDNKKNKTNKQDQKDDKQDKQKQDKQKQEQQKKDQQKQQQQKQDMSKDNAEQLLNAAIQQEKATQEKMKKAMRQAGTRKLQKNW